jgi:hypothetical protein
MKAALGAIEPCVNKAGPIGGGLRAALHSRTSYRTAYATTGVEEESKERRDAKKKRYTT